jgi:hypothetical protein
MITTGGNSVATDMSSSYLTAQQPMAARLYSNIRSIERLYECLLHGYDRNQEFDTPIEQMFESLLDPG